jgi:hypothetical protein
MWCSLARSGTGAYAAHGGPTRAATTPINPPAHSAAHPHAGHHVHTQHTHTHTHTQHTHSTHSTHTAHTQHTRSVTALAARDARMHEVTSRPQCVLRCSSTAACQPCASQLLPASSFCCCCCCDRAASMAAAVRGTQKQTGTQGDAECMHMRMRMFQRMPLTRLLCSRMRAWMSLSPKPGACDVRRRQQSQVCQRQHCQPTEAVRSRIARSKTRGTNHQRCLSRTTPPPPPPPGGASPHASHPPVV